jgi:hypothetical protein
VEQNREAGQNPPRVVAPCEEEDNFLYEGKHVVATGEPLILFYVIF